MQYLVLLMNYKRWANQLLFDHLQQIPESVLTASRLMVFGSILKTLNHVRLMDLAWQANLTDQPHGINTRNPAASPDFKDVRQSQFEVDLWSKNYSSKLSDESARQDIEFEFIGG